MSENAEFFEYSKNFRGIFVGLSSGSLPDDVTLQESPNAYAVSFSSECKCCFLAGKEHPFKWPTGVDGEAILPKWNDTAENVIGCGLLLNANNNLAIYFTLNGQLIGHFLAYLCNLIYNNFSGLIYRKRANSNHPFNGGLSLSVCLHQ
jgi:hypothetical protein